MDFPPCPQPMLRGSCPPPMGYQLSFLNMTSGAGGRSGFFALGFEFSVAIPEAVPMEGTL